MGPEPLGDIIVFHRPYGEDKIIVGISLGPKNRTHKMGQLSQLKAMPMILNQNSS